MSRYGQDGNGKSSEFVKSFRIDSILNKDSARSDILAPDDDENSTTVDEDHIRLLRRSTPTSKLLFAT